MKKIIIAVVILMLMAAQSFGATLTVTLTDEQAAIIKDELQGYAVALAVDRLNQKKENERSAQIKVLIAKTPAELTAAAAPIIAAEKAKLEAVQEK